MRKKYSAFGLHLEVNDLAADIQLHGLAIPLSQHALLPLKGALFVDQPKEDFPQSRLSRYPEVFPAPP